MSSEQVYPYYIVSEVKDDYWIEERCGGDDFFARFTEIEEAWQKVRDLKFDDFYLSLDGEENEYLHTQFAVYEISLGDDEQVVIKRLKEE